MKFQTLRYKMPKRMKCSVPGCEDQGEGTVLFQFPKSGKKYGQKWKISQALR